MNASDDTNLPDLRIVPPAGVAPAPAAGPVFPPGLSGQVFDQDDAEASPAMDADADDGAELDDWKDALREDFESWLESLDGIPDEDAGAAGALDDGAQIN